MAPNAAAIEGNSSELLSIDRCYRLWSEDAHLFGENE